MRENMRGTELIAEINGNVSVSEKSCDILLNPECDRTLTRVAVSMFATVEILQQAKDWGADLLIVHEPVLLQNAEAQASRAKAEQVRSAGFPIYRDHDHAHASDPDLITEGGLRALGLHGKIEKTPYYASYLFQSDTTVTARELLNRMQNGLGLRYVRLAGEMDHPASRLAVCFGAPGGVYELLCREDVEILLVGEACEWNLCEYARDAVALGFHKSVIVMGHIGSEREGMKLLAERIAHRHPELEVRYFECGEVFAAGGTRTGNV